MLAFLYSILDILCMTLEFYDSLMRKKKKLIFLFNYLNGTFNGESCDKKLYSGYDGSLNNANFCVKIQ